MRLQRTGFCVWRAHNTTDLVRRTFVVRPKPSVLIQVGRRFTRPQPEKRRGRPLDERVRPVFHTRNRDGEVVWAVPLGEITNTELRVQTAMIISTGLPCFCLGIFTIPPSGRSHASK